MPLCSSHVDEINGCGKSVFSGRCSSVRGELSLNKVYTSLLVSAERLSTPDAVSIRQALQHTGERYTFFFCL